MTSREVTSFLPLAGHGAEKSLAEMGMVILYGAIGWPWLLKSLSGGTKAAKRALLQRLALPADALPNLGSWKADTGFLHLIIGHIEAHRPQNVVELGAGATSLVIGRALQLHGGGHLLSLDQHEGFIHATHDWLREHGVQADLRHAPLGDSPGNWPGCWYETGPMPDQIDLLVIDGPPWTIHPFVRGAAEALFDRIPVGGTVLLDDAARPGERVIAGRWRRKWTNFSFRLVSVGTKGTLIGTRLR
ncbi:class I SAM-dependent methyltransferase [Sphingomonas soli]|uniref:class I SAM-dependent methyltransferase n=1 Tax=Sphingomonas soli TaxID=266127 RepID=UPI00082FADDD|nr:class I SAM-dependent methyltransferase [Sphingomonas soli]